MLESGYAAVTYRAVAAAAGVAPALVQYYFPTLDDVFVAAIRRRSEQNLARLIDALRANVDAPLRVLWDYSRDEVNAALTTEFLALGNHRKSIRKTIAEVTDRVRRVQLDAVQAKYGRKAVAGGDFSPSALLFLVTGVPKLIRLEEGVGITTNHTTVLKELAQYLAACEPLRPSRARRR
jgi:AcrR family transcriptional regulator